jgi:mono/diheme cytochrome c family protein
LEGLWVSWGLNETDEQILKELSKAKSYKARAAAARVARYSGKIINNQSDLLMTAAGDDHGRARLEAITAASWLAPEKARSILAKAAEKDLDKHMVRTHQAAMNTINGIVEDVDKPRKRIKTHLKGSDKALFTQGAKIYEREGHCGTCHQPDGKGLAAAQFPPIKGSRWVTESEERLIKLTLNGLLGPIEVKGMHYPGQVPMTPFRGMLDNKEIAAVLTYVRNSFGHKASVITPEKVAKVRAATKDKVGFYQPAELQKLHPHKK